MHNKWALKAGIDELIANYVNRIIDYGLDWTLSEELMEQTDEEIEENKITKQLKFFYKKDLEKKFSNENLYVRAFYMHHLLDYFRETRHNIHNLDLIFEKFLKEKVIIEFEDKERNNVNFQNEISKIFQLIKRNKQELYKDLLGK